MSYEELVLSLRGNVNAAVDYLRAQWDRFANLSPAIIDLQHRAAVAAYNATQRGDLEGAESARDVIRKLGTLNVKHGQAVETMRSVAQYIGLGGLSGYYSGLGVAIPAAQITAITGLALLVAWFFRAYAAEERKLELIEAGVITPEQLHLLDPGPAPAMVLGQATGLAKVLLAGAVLYVGYQLATQSGLMKGLGKKRARRNPPLVLFDSNPPGAVIGEETFAVWYQHALDGAPYVHEFGPDVELLAEPDGTVRLEHRGGAELWNDFDVEPDELEEEDELEELGLQELDDDDEDLEEDEWDDDEDLEELNW